jgi:uncharacterized protein (TIGR03382 family)
VKSTRHMALVIVSVSAVGAGTAHAFEYASLPADNLIVNPWFRGDCEWSIAGWETSPAVSWSLSDKTQDPTDVNCVVDGQAWYGFAARWAHNSGADPAFHPDQPALMWQVVGPVDPDERTLRFHFLFVAHRFNQLKAEIYGSNSTDGPWTSVWVPMDKEWLDAGGASGAYRGACPGGLEDRDCWWDLTTEEELGSLSPLTHTTDQGYSFYKIELLGNYPQPDATTTGDVGGKIARVYFSVQAGGDPGNDPGDESEDETGHSSSGCATSGSNATSGTGLLLVVLWWLSRRRRHA